MYMKRKKILIGIAIAVIVATIIITIVINVNKNKKSNKEEGIYYPQETNYINGNEIIGDANTIFVVK